MRVLASWPYLTASYIFRQFEKSLLISNCVFSHNSHFILHINTLRPVNKEAIDFYYKYNLNILISLCAYVISSIESKINQFFKASHKC